MYIYFGIVERTAPLEKGGELVKLDMENKTIVDKCRIVPGEPDTSFDPNPRGQSRGCRGIEIVGDKIVAANYHSLEIFDLALNKIKTVSHDLMVGLHEIHHKGGQKIWVSSTAIDSVLLVDIRSGEVIDQYWPREREYFQQKLGIKPLEIDKSADNRNKFLTHNNKEDPGHLHLNAVTTHKGDTYVLFNKFGIVANLSKKEIVLNDPRIKGAHNLAFGDQNSLLLNETYRGATLAFDLKSKNLINSYRISNYSPVRKLEFWPNINYFVTRVMRNIGLIKSPIAARPLFVRGLSIAEDMIYVGISPATILCIKRKTKELENYYTYSKDVKVAIHGLTTDKSNDQKS